MAGSELLVLNPRRRRRKAKAKVGRRKKRRVRRHAIARHNPRHIARRRRRSSSRRRRVGRRVRRNPRIGGALQGPIGTGIAVFAGGIATEVLADKLASMIPASWNVSADVARIGTKAAIGIGVPLLAGKFLPRGWGKWIAVGGTVVTLFDIFKTYVAPKIPGLHLTGYEIGPTGTGIATDTVGFSGFEQDGGMSGGVYDGNVYG